MVRIGLAYIPALIIQNFDTDIVICNRNVVISATNVSTVLSRYLCGEMKHDSMRVCDDTLRHNV